MVWILEVWVYQVHIGDLMAEYVEWILDFDPNDIDCTIYGQELMTSDSNRIWNGI